MGKKGGDSLSSSDIERISGPFGPTRQPLTDLFGDFAKYYKDPTNFDNFNYGPGVVQGFNPIQQAGQQGLLDYAAGGIPGFGAGINNIGQYASGQNSAPGFDFLTGLQNGSGNSPATAGYDALAGRATAGTYGNTGLDSAAAFARGDYLGANPYLENQISAATRGITKNYQDTVNPALEGMVSRTGSGGGGGVEALLRQQNEDQLQQNLGDVETNIRNSAYINDRSQQLAAAQGLPGMEATGVNTALAGLGGQSSVYQQNLNNQITGQQGLQNLYQQNFQNQLGATGALPGLFEGGATPFNIFNSVGGTQQGQAERAAGENQQRFQFDRDRFTNYNNQYLQTLLAGAGAGNPQVAAQLAASQQGQPSAFQQGFGNLLGIGALATSFFAPGAGAALGGVNAGLRAAQG